jgi:cytidylate kinase
VSADALLRVRGSSVDKRTIVTVDGVSASGKSAIARLLAEKLGFAHLNSGLLYRATGYLVSQEGIDASDDAAVSAMLGRHLIELRYDRSRGNEVVIDGSPRDAEVSTESVSRLASQVAKLKGVREHFISVQRQAFIPMGVVAEGRDMGTVIFPDAETKFFITAPLQVRAERRQRQLAAKGEAVSVAVLEQALDARDTEDSSRSLSPMKAAEGAIVIENAGKTLEDIVQEMVTKVPRR